MTLLRAASVIVAMPSLNSGTAGPSLSAILGCGIALLEVRKCHQERDYDRRPAALLFLLRSLCPPAKGPETHKRRGLLGEMRPSLHHGAEAPDAAVRRTLLDQDASPLPLAQLVPKLRLRRPGVVRGTGAATPGHRAASRPSGLPSEIHRPAKKSGMDQGGVEIDVANDREVARYAQAKNR